MPNEMYQWCRICDVITEYNEYIVSIFPENRYCLLCKHKKMLVLSQEPRNYICGECGEFQPKDDRVKAGMKCSRCAYGG